VYRRQAVQIVQAIEQSVDRFECLERFELFERLKNTSTNGTD
jgi:hypothetical protein